MHEVNFFRVLSGQSISLAQVHPLERSRLIGRPEMGLNSPAAGGWIFPSHRILRVTGASDQPERACNGVRSHRTLPSPILLLALSADADAIGRGDVLLPVDESASGHMHVISPPPSCA